MRRLVPLLLLPLLWGCTDDSPLADRPAARRCPGPQPVVEGPTVTVPMRRSEQPTPVSLGRGQSFQGVLPPEAGDVTVTVEQDADAARRQPERTVPRGDRLLPFQAVDRGSVTVVATSRTDSAVRYALSVTIAC